MAYQHFLEYDQIHHVRTSVGRSRAAFGSPLNLSCLESAGLVAVTAKCESGGGKKNPYPHTYNTYIQSGRRNSEILYSGVLFRRTVQIVQQK